MENLGGHIGKAAVAILPVIAAIKALSLVIAICNAIMLMNPIVAIVAIIYYWDTFGETVQNIFGGICGISSQESSG